MPTIRYIEYQGTEHVVDVPVGISVMEGAVKNGIPGIVADCGGACACATCHVYVDPQWAERVGEAADMERDMLDCAEDVTSHSRLACQIRISDALDGMIVRMPTTQRLA